MKIRSIVTAGIAVLALVSAAVEAPSAAAEPNGSRSCSFSFFDGRPQVQARHGNSAVIGGGYAHCVPAPRTFHVSLTLEFKTAGSDWEVRGAAQDGQIPNPRLNLAAWAPCEPGAWRVAATIWTEEYGEPQRFSTRTPATILNC
ncbi:hypothetical protein [Nocardia sp. Marseille-Q1738]